MKRGGEAEREGMRGTWGERERDSLIFFLYERRTGHNTNNLETIFMEKSSRNEHNKNVLCILSHWPLKVRVLTSARTQICSTHTQTIKRWWMESNWMKKYKKKTHSHGHVSVIIRLLAVHVDLSHMRTARENRWCHTLNCARHWRCFSK